MEFARRGRDDDDDAYVDDEHRFIHLQPPHVDPMLVIREALLSQLQKDRLRQEIIQAELAKIEHAMVLRNGSRHGISTDDVECTKSVPFTFREQSMPPWRWSASQECYVDVDEIHDPKQKEGRHRSVALKSEKPTMEDSVSECLRPCCCNGKAGQENSKLEDQKSQESIETIQPKTTSPSLKWELTGITIPVKKRHQKLSCEICQVQVPSKHLFQKHCAGRKHRSKEASNQKVQLTEKSSPLIGQKTSSIKWSCSTCQVNGTSESNLKEHLNGRTHQQNTEALLMEGDGIAKNNELQEAENSRHKAAIEGGRGNKGKHQCPRCGQYGHHWRTCKDGDSADIEAMKLERGEPKKKKKVAANPETSIVPFSAPRMTFPATLSTSASVPRSNNRKRKLLPSPPVTTTHEKEGEKVKSVAGKKRTVEGKKKAASAKKKVAGKEGNKNTSSPAMGTRSKVQSFPSSQAMGTRSKRQLQV